MSEFKRLYRTENEDRRVAGVAGGLAEFFGIDPTIIRVVWLIAVLCGGFGLIPYIIMALIVPNKSEVYPGY